MKKEEKWREYLSWSRSYYSLLITYGTNNRDRSVVEQTWKNGHDMNIDPHLQIREYPERDQSWKLTIPWPQKKRQRHHQNHIWIVICEKWQYKCPNKYDMLL